MDGDVLHIDTPGLEHQFERFLRYSTKGIEPEFDTTCRGLINETFALIPPASGHTVGVKVSEADYGAQARGERRILRTMKAAFKPVPIKGRRLITHVFGKPMKNPVYVATKERWPNPEQIYKVIMSEKTANRRFSVPGTRKQKFWVDINKFNALAAKLMPRVGYAAAGFAAAARLLGARVPSYARRHPSNGSVTREVNDERLHFQMSNDVGYVSFIPDVAALIERAARAEAGKLERQLPHIIRAAGKQAGLAAAA